MASFKAIQSEDKEDDTQWLTYWVVYAFFACIDGLISVFFGSKSVSAAMNYIFTPERIFGCKLGFQIWLYAPSTQGAEICIQYLFTCTFKRKRKCH